MRKNTDKEKCIDCNERARCRDSYAAWIFFIIGIFATLAVRAVTVLMHIKPLYGQIAWYIGVVGFLFFFSYKFRLYSYRSKVVRENNLAQKIQERELTQEEKDVVSAILCGLSSRKESINYLFIFILSAIAIVVAVYFDFFRGGG